MSDNKQTFDYNKLKRQEKQTCRGLSSDRTPCRYAVEDGKNCCTRAHTELENYTENKYYYIWKQLQTL